MASLRVLCFAAPSSSVPSNLTNPSPTNLSPKPSYIPTKTLHQSSIDLSLPLPDLPMEAREKILTLEVMGINSGRVLTRNPDLRGASPDAIQAVLSYLLDKGIHHKDLTRIIGMCPRILTSSVANDLAPIFAFLSRDLKIPEAHFRRVVNKCPRLLICSVRDQLRPALIYLQRLGFKNASALAYHDPTLLVCSVENTLMPKLQHLMELGLTNEEAVGMVLRCPGLFTFSIENNLKPKYEYLVKEMGRRLEELKEFPQYFAFSLENRIKPRHREMVNAGVRLTLPMLLKSKDENFKAMLALGGR
ncbi:hypothetical protein HPP92_000830 [Vanilla planifolia]|uniref:Uncharacterized protein n=1 Tax=Vanilla planifolia TaxID=51239 RepID=A0A835S1D7_VANPL|nr:hypothetical protein HPP92_000830 [Vanilla planifolia]